VTARDAATEVRGPVEQMLAVVLPGFAGTGRPRRALPFGCTVPGESRTKPIWRSDESLLNWLASL
jgi:hypothetical protein